MLFGPVVVSALPLCRVLVRGGEASYSSLSPVTPPKDLAKRLSAALGDRYRVERQVGRGGMATVFQAHDYRHEREVAIKVLRPELAASVGIERFLREIKLAARLSHPHILPLFDSGEADGLLYYVMPFVEGESLRDRITREKQLPQDDIIDIGIAVAQALDYAHRHDIIHRDIKPENILMLDGVAVVADYGIGKAVSGVSLEDITATGVAIGTPAYMSPEQAAGESELDGRSDLYSLGCVLFELLTGEPPFRGTTAQEVISRRFAGPVPRASTVRSTVSSGMDDIVSRCLARLPADRFATGAHLAQALANSRSQQWTAGSPAAAHPERSVAVLPFANLSSDPANEYLSDGLSEELIHALSKIDGLRVVGRTSAFAFKGKNEDVRTIGERLNVGAVLEGSVRVSGDRLRITVQLVSTSDGYELLSESYLRSCGDVLEVQMEIAQAIVTTLQVALVASEPPLFDAATDSFEAYESYLKGRFHWNKRTEDGLRQSIALLKESVRVDPAFAVAYAGLADSYATLGIYGADPTSEVMPLARAAADEALRLDANLPEALTSLGCVASVYEWDWDTAEAYFRRAIDANPKYPTAHHWYAVNCLAPLGRFREAEAQLRRARALDPLSQVITVSSGLCRFLQRQYRQAVQEYDAALDVESGFAMAYYFRGQAYERLGEHDRALADLYEANRLSGGSPEITAALGHVHATAGQAAEAHAVVASLESMSGQRFVSPALIAQVYAGLGDHEQALRWLDKGREVRAPEMVWLSVRPLFDQLRLDPRFIDLLRRVGFAEGTIAETDPARFRVAG
jgi:eukaryotic-like serine/threonine-protein kinase